MKVLSLLKQLAAKFGVDESCVREYGLVPHKGDTSTFYDEGRTLAACNLADGVRDLSIYLFIYFFPVNFAADGCCTLRYARSSGQCGCAHRRQHEDLLSFSPRSRKASHR